MNVLPRWKITRELRRLGRQIKGAPRNLVTYLFSTMYYDHVLARKKSEFHGDLPERSKIAIFLIFPQYGVKPSHLRALDHFDENGYATLVVSNIDLSEGDRARVIKRCWHLILRPNYGYDFGGYRDGVLALENRLNKLDRLVLMNDSCWYPLSQQDSWLRKAETLGSNYVGAATHYGTPRVEPSDFRSIRWEYDSSSRNFHYSSFALSIDSDILRDPDFLMFWKNFRLTNDKSQAVRRGEIGLTHWVLRRSYSHAPTLDITYLDQELASLPSGRLMEIFKRLIFHEDIVSLKNKKDVLNRCKEFTSGELVSFVLAGVSRQGASYALAEYMIKEKGYSFIKKSPVWANEESSDITLALIQDLSEPFFSEIHGEARELRQKKARF